MSVEKIRQKRIQNEEREDELRKNVQELAQQEEMCQRLYQELRRLNEDLLDDFQETPSFYRQQEYADIHRQQEAQLMGVFDACMNHMNRRRKQVEEDNEALYQEELTLLKKEEESHG